MTSKMKKLLALVMALSLVACGGGAASTSAPAASSPADASAPAVSTPAEESDLDYIKDKGEMIIGYTVYAPMNFTDDNGVLILP